MKRKIKQGFPFILLCSGFIFLLLLLTMLISNGIIFLCVEAGWIQNRPESPLVPFLVQSGVISVLTGMILTLILSYFPLRPMTELIHAIHAVAEGDFHTKLHLKHPRQFRAVSDSFNQMTAELAGTELLRSDFINNFSHEFKTPVVSILGFAGLLKKEHVSEQQKEEYLDIIISECKRLSTLSSNVLNLSRLENMALLRDTVSCNVTEQIREAILQLEQKWNEKAVSFDLQMEECYIKGQPDLLKQIWLNLIDNAVKFSYPESSILIQAEQNDTQFFFRIRDTGIGMDAQTCKNIFDRFYQGDTSHAAEGNGLGLCLVKKIIELHHGSVSVQSSPGGGSVFTVTLPPDCSISALPAG